MGTSVGTRIFVRHGWRAAAVLSLAWNIWQMCILLLRGPHCKRFTWVGWECGYEMRKEEMVGNGDVEKGGDGTPTRSDSSKHEREHEEKHKPGMDSEGNKT